MLHIELGVILTILYRLVRHLQIVQILIILNSDSIFNLLLFSLDGLELAMVPNLDAEPVALDIVYGGRPLVIKDASVLILDEFLSGAQVLLIVHLIILKVVHVLHEFVPSRHVFDSFLSLLFLLL